MDANQLQEPTGSDFNSALRAQEIQPLKDRINTLEQERSILQAQVKRMQPLIQAARVYVNGITDKHSLLKTVGPLIDAADEYEVHSCTFGTEVNLDD